MEACLAVSFPANYFDHGAFFYCAFPTMQPVEKVWGSELDDQLLYCPGSSTASSQGTPASQSEVFLGSAGSASISPRFAFNSTGSAVCMWSSRRLRCYLGGFTVNFSTSFDWSPVSDLPTVAFPLDDCQPANWRIVDTLLLPFPYTASVGKAGKGTTQGLAVLLTSKTVSRSLLCFLPDLRTPSRGRTISLHGKAVMLGPVSPDSSQSSVPLSGILGAFSETVFAGVLAIAFEHGLVALIDLCLDWPVDKVRLNFRAEPAVASALAQSRKLLADDQRVSPFSPALEHTLMHLNDSAVSWDRFYYQLPNEKVAIKIPSQSVTVTLLQNIRPIKSLVVGFSFGGWQIWRLTDLKLIYTFQNPSLHCAVVSCAFVEPSDDPRYCCYLWVGWQAPKKSSRRRKESKEDTAPPGPTVPTCTLFQLGFRNRIEHTHSVTKDTVYEYDNFFGASPRLSTKLAALSSFTSETPFVSQLKAIQSLSSSYTANRGLHSSGLTAITWRATVHIVRIGLFDIDRWYHAQMPSAIWPDNSFFAVYDAGLDSSKSYPLTAQVLPQSLLAFWVRTLRLERASAGRCGTTRTKRRADVSNGVPLLRKPLPEVQLRPSVHAFEALVPFAFSGSGNQRPDDSCCPQLTGNFVSLKFVSRQEKCLRDLSRACLCEKQPSSSVFNVCLWITEAIACGLVRELEDAVVDDVSRMLDDSDPLMGVRLSLGLDNVTPEVLEELGVDPYERFSDELAHDVDTPRLTSQKRRRLVSEQGQAEVTTGGGGGQTLAEILRPQWVVVANTLFEQKMLRELMGLSRLKNASSFGATASENSFMRAWIWLRWLGQKSTFDKLCKPILFTVAAGVEAEETDSRNLSSSTLDEISLCVNQLRDLADIAFNILAPNLPTERQDDAAADTDRVRSSDRLRIIRAYSDYTRTLCLLLRLGLLPQAVSEDAVTPPVFGKFGCVRRLTPYCPAPLARLINSYQKRYADLPRELQSQEDPFSPPITGRLLKHLLGQTEEEVVLVADDTSIARNIWMDQENLAGAGGSSQPVVYPPRRLQSVCALWQAWDAPAKARTALLIFLLFDWVAVMALMPAASTQPSDDKGEEEEDPNTRKQRRVRYRSQSPEEISPTARAIKMHKYVVKEFLKEFPTEKPLLTAIQTLWLFDRCRFKEILASDLSPIVTGQVTSLSQLPEIFPNQAQFLVRLSLFFGQTRLALLFDPAHSTDDPALYENFLPANPRAPTAPLGELTRLRRMYASVPEDEAAALFLQCLRYFLKYGRLLDLLNADLSSWETNILTDYLKSNGHRDLLFCCLLARSQYKAAANLVSEIDPNLPAAFWWGKSNATSATRGRDDQACVELLKIVDSCLSLNYRLRREPADEEVPTDVALRPFSSRPHTTSDSGPPLSDGQMEEDAGRFEAVSLVRGPAFLRTPKTATIPVHLSTVDRDQRSEFWRMYNKMQAMDKRSSDFKSPSPMRPLVTASVRRRHEKMLGYVYSEPVDSARKSTRRRSGSRLPYPSTDSRHFHSTAEVRQKLDFWSELRRWHKPGAPGDTVCETTVLPDASFLKPSPSKAMDSLQTTEDDEVSTEQSCADSEVTINPRTLTLHEDGAPVETPGRPQSPEAFQLDSAPVLSSTSRLLKHLEAVSSDGLSTSFTFSPPINLLRAHRTAENPLQSIFSSHFAFSSPTSLRCRMSDVVESPQSDLNETDVADDSTSNVHEESGVSNVASCSASGEGSQNPLSSNDLDSDESEKPNSSEFMVGEVAFQKADYTEQSDELASVASKDSDDEPELFTPRRSRRHAKRPDRYQAA
ncbi:hypothetical protein AAHC03_010069 [Spirometra sp. Aus1]